MRRTALLGLILVATPILAAIAGDSAAEWLDKASNPDLTRLERKYAASQLRMLADQSASMFISLLASTDRQDAAKRPLAASLLGEIRCSKAEPALLNALFSPDYFLAQAAAEALVKIYAALPDEDLYWLLRHGAPKSASLPGDSSETDDDWLALSLEDAKNKGQFRALVMRAAAAKHRDEAAPLSEAILPYVWDSLLDANRDLRAAAVEAARFSHSPLAPGRLSAFLYQENDPNLLAAALEALAELRPPDFGAAAERHVAHADPQVALEALACLAAMGYGNVLFPPGAKTVAQFVNHPSTPVRRRAIAILAETKDPRASEYLIFALGDRAPANRLAAARALGKLGFTVAIGALSPLLGDANPQVREEAAVALEQLGVVGPVARMLDDLEHGASLFQYAAARALGRIGDKRAVPYLVQALAGDQELAATAAFSLGRIGDRSAGPGLYRMMTSSNDPVLSDAARQALARLYNGDDPGDSQDAWRLWALRNKLDNQTGT